MLSFLSYKNFKCTFLDGGSVKSMKEVLSYHGLSGCEVYPVSGISGKKKKKTYAECHYTYVSVSRYFY